MISVIIPAYNSGNYLREAVTSALSQTYRAIEVIIIDDCSSDGTLALAQALSEEDSRVRVIENKTNMGVAASRNRGIDAAEGRYIAFLDADDIWLPDKLHRQISLIEETGADICYTGYAFIDDEGITIRRPYRVPESVDMRTMLKENVIGCSTAVFSREKIASVRMRGEYAHEDYVFWLELMQSGCKAVGTGDILMQYRISLSNRSGDKKKAARNRWIIYRNFLGMGAVKSAWWFMLYSINGIVKHFI